MQTATQGRLGFARVLVEVQVNGDLPDVVPLNSSRYGKCSIPVTYEWCPTQCSKFSRWGHQEYLCPKAAPQEVEVTTQVEKKENSDKGGKSSIVKEEVIDGDNARSNENVVHVHSTLSQKGEVKALRNPEICCSTK